MMLVVVLCLNTGLENIKCYDEEIFHLGLLPPYEFTSRESELTLCLRCPHFSRMVPWQRCQLQDWREVGSSGRKWPADELHVSWEWKGRIQVRSPYVILTMISRPLSTPTFLTEPKHSFMGWAQHGGLVSLVVGKPVACFRSESWLNVMSKHVGTFMTWALWSSAVKCCIDSVFKIWLQSSRLAYLGTSMSCTKALEHLLVIHLSWWDLVCAPASRGQVHQLESTWLSLVLQLFLLCAHVQMKQRVMTTGRPTT